MKKFGIAVHNMPGFDQTGRFFNRNDVQKCTSWASAMAEAINRASFGAPYREQFAACVVRHVPGKGWKVVQQHNCAVWDD